MSKQALIELRSLFFTYGCHPVLDNVNLEINHGESVGLLGPNGSGKTTLLKLILGQLRPHSGTVKVFGVEAHRLRERYRIGYVAQRATHFNTEFPATVREVVASGRVPRRGLFRLLTSQDYQRVDQALDMVGLSSMCNQPVGTLSGGQQQRVFIARAMVSEPEILIMDEPTVGIDSAAQASFYELLKKLNIKENITLLIVSHEMEGLSSVISRQVCLDKNLCSCNCHSYPAKKMQVSCSKRLAFQYAK
ncbi:metal ABC transporter ATP-binding protein [Desulforamulus aquiferis]|uniref:Metal ABC transporter ATP-binding protein n=1 Tax=Desulforamulus aquiferis TaxID=1397668 RepID=A0AAW7ZHG2_9FIRM|nr:metal ABC transporter ATP-binding protein [Desulforamulus aquiferis]MDO7788754.1 metal ABC transporter ATP-binding protein [Desulforamulus aquiferis]